VSEQKSPRRRARGAMSRTFMQYRRQSGMPKVEGMVDAKAQK